MRHKNGTPFVAWVTDAPLLDLDGNTVGIIGLSVPARSSEETGHPGGRSAVKRQLDPGSQPERSGPKFRVAVIGEARLRAPLEALIRRHPGRLEPAERSPSVTLVAAGDTPPYDLPVVSSLLAVGNNTSTLIAIGNPTPDNVLGRVWAATSTVGRVLAAHDVDLPAARRRPPRGARRPWPDWVSYRPNQVWGFDVTQFRPAGRPPAASR